MNTGKIHDILINIGIPSNLLGYGYILYAIELILFQPDYMRAVTAKLYVDIAEKFNTTPERVERNMRHAIGIGWLHGDMDFINHIFKNCVNPERGVPSNSLFLSRIYYYLITTAA